MQAMSSATAGVLHKDLQRFPVILNHRGVIPAKEHTKRSPAGGQARFPAGRVFLQGCFADRLRDGRFECISWLWRNGLEQIPCAGRAGNFGAAAGNFFATTGKNSISPGTAYSPHHGPGTPGGPAENRQDEDMLESAEDHRDTG